MAMNQVALIIAQFVNPRGLKNIGWRHYIVFCVLLVALLVIQYLVFPETNKRTLEDIAEISEGSGSEETVASKAVEEVERTKGAFSLELEQVK
ncbi:hypothetical protein PV08_05162 [Exophiala spinifera]|uniref:Major facilitator superfamily (MFS) profile domain-containing protein n=1 Tax=Exophiala spinifera TaxID=91928 RepID=A0A0D1ZZ81_9EURO|nr:uncharacterized protein PV08_05162 [Exophiala spinifera]KIW17967.1 hypothetical protein PV08_05162 [Exophiala spinifera]